MARRALGGLLPLVVVVAGLALRLPSSALRRVARRHRLRDTLARRGDRPRWALDVGDLPDAGDFVVCFVNPASGGRRGRRVLAALRRALHPAQVVDLGRPGAAERALALLAPLTRNGTATTADGRRVAYRPRLRAVACGGDGTVAWVADLLRAAAARDARFSPPPLAVAPLGTGNDLARVLGWGGGLPLTGFDAEAVLDRVARATPARLDRWSAAFDGAPRTMLNYLGLGCDAEARRRDRAPGGGETFRRSLSNSTRGGSGTRPSSRRRSSTSSPTSSSASASAAARRRTRRAPRSSGTAST